MKIKKHFLWFAAAVAIAAVLSAGHAMAFCDGCQAPPPVTASDTTSGWKIALDSVVNNNNGTWDWTYKITNTAGTASGLNTVSALIPVCCNGLIGVTPLDNFTKLFGAGIGEPTDRFGYGNMEATVIKGTQADATLFKFRASTPDKTKSSVLMSVRKYGNLKFELAVPGCRVPIVTQTALSFTVQKDNGTQYEVKIEKDTAGNITSILSRQLPNGTWQTVNGIPIGTIQVSYDGGLTYEPMRFIPDDTATKTGDASTCGYWYQGYFYNFCF